MMLTQEYLKNILEYNPETGEFIWLQNINSRARKNKKAGTSVLNKRTGLAYHKIGINGFYYKRCDLAYLYMIGEFPKKILDHKDTNSLNDSWNNLRLVTYSENRYNSKVKSNNLSTGIKGVDWSIIKGNGYARAGVQVKGKRYRKVFSQAIYKTKESTILAAIDWVKNLRLELHGEFANHG